MKVVKLFPENKGCLYCDGPASDAGAEEKAASTNHWQGVSLSSLLNSTNSKPFSAAAVAFF
jgi:hypothetical protein